MTNIFENDREFKEGIGAFIIALSELEFGLVFLCALTEFDIRMKDNYIMKYLGFPFEKKVQHLTEFIEQNLNEVKSTWDDLKLEIGQLNRERRFIIHGFMSYSLPHETITTQVKEKGKIATKQQSLENIRKFTKRLYDLNSGKNGINGEFNTVFTKSRIDQWNSLVNDENKIIYEVNGVVISDYKGVKGTN